MQKLTFEELENAVSGTSAGFRAVTRLEPLGGPHDKLYPPTFGDAVHVPVPVGQERQENRRSKYALEWRRINGSSKLCVVLDSVASQANRMELSLLEAYERGELLFPFARVDFTGERNDDPALDLSTLGRDGYITTLEAPHRLADALLRDSLLDGKPFRYTEPGRRFTEASSANATPLFALCPASLIFGLWDSTGPKGGLGSKFQRTIVSEIVGVGVELGARTSSRIDPTGIEKTDIYVSNRPQEDGSEDWTAELSEAKLDKNKPVLLKRGGEKAGSPAVINHGNVKPSQDPETGGVTVEYAEQLTVLSLPALRRLRFATTPDGKRLEASARRKAEDAARTLLAALALAAVAYQRVNGFDLRSRCALRALHPLMLELIPGDGEETRTFSLDCTTAKSLFDQAKVKAVELGMSWAEEPLTLVPAPKLVGLIRRSRQQAVVEATTE